VAFSHRIPAILMVGAALSCGGRAPVVVAPAPATPEAAVDAFMTAVNASDLRRMAELWGTERGPSAVTNPNTPETRQRQLTIMQRILASESHRVLGTDAALSGPGRTVLHVELVRGGRRVSVPFTLVAARTGGWLVNAIGLDAALPQSTPSH
jgi:hypothetical protein